MLVFEDMNYYKIYFIVQLQLNSYNMYTSGVFSLDIFTNGSDNPFPHECATVTVVNNACINLLF